jgi:co-chaperonin GroES (HSP10)
MHATVVGVTPETEATTANLRPFWGRIMVIPSSVDEHERRSGLIVPMEYEGDEQVRRGVVVHIDNWRAEPTETARDLLPGTIVYYKGGVRVADAVILERNEILAYEVDE